MGNECPECQTPVAECKVRDVLKEIPRDRKDLDLSSIKKGDYKRQTNKFQLDDSDESQVPELIVVESHVVSKGSKKREDPIIKKTRSEMDKSSLEAINKPLSMQAQTQTVVLSHGLKYIGSTIDSQPHQKGKVIWPDGTTMLANFFLGHLAENQPVTLKMSDSVVYEGEIYQGKANSKGKITLADGSSFQGQWRDDLPHGFGKHKMSDGSFYEGEFVKGVKNGHGKYYFDKGMYEGGFQNDQFSGEGIMIMNDGRTIKGFWKNGLLEGQGQIDWASGQKYSGSFSRSCREGEGTYWYADGRQWTGEWENDLQNGFGSYQLPSGQVIKGIWVKGVKKDEMRGSKALP